MRALIVLTVCVSACLAHGNYGGDSGFRSGGNRQGNLIDYPFTVEVTRSSSDTGNYRSLNVPQPQQQQQQQRPQIQQRQTNNARSQTQYIDIPYIVETSRQQQQPQVPSRSFQQPQIRQQPQVSRSFQQPQIRQQPQVSRSFQQPQIREQPQVRQQQVRQQPIFQIERSQAVASFDWPQQQQQQQQQRSFTSGNQGGSSRSQSQLIDYPFTVEVISSSGSTGGQGRNSNFGSQW